MIIYIAYMRYYGLFIEIEIKMIDILHLTY